MANVASNDEKFSLSDDLVALNRLYTEDRRPERLLQIIKTMPSAVKLCLDRACLLAAARNGDYVPVETADWLAMAAWEMVKHIPDAYKANAPLVSNLIQCLIHTHRDATGKQEMYQALAYSAEAFEKQYGDKAGYELALVWASPFGYAASGFPNVRLSKKVATALLYTKATPDQLAEIELPWEGFSVEIPPGVVADGAVSARVSRQYHYTNPWASYEGVISYGLRIQQPIEVGDIYRQSPKIGNLLLLNDETFTRDENSAPVPFSEPEQELSEAVAKICACLLLRLNYGKDDGARLAPSVRSEIISRVAPKPRLTHYVFHDDVKIDLTEAHATARKLGGERARASVRWIVRGHYANLAVGKGRKDRRMTWRRPHWHGKKNAPMLIRDYVVPEGA